MAAPETFILPEMPVAKEAPHVARWLTLLAAIRFDSSLDIIAGLRYARQETTMRAITASAVMFCLASVAAAQQLSSTPDRLIVNIDRSEERRVGKECRSRW